MSTTRPSARAWLAAACSLPAPGLGHLLGGRFRAAAAIIVLDAVVVTAGVAVLLAPRLGRPSLLVALLGFVAWRLWVVRSAFRSAREPVRHRRLVWMGAVIGFAILSVGVDVALEGLARGQRLDAYRLPTGAMAPTLLMGDYVLTRSLDRPPAPGELVVHHWPVDTSKRFIKRVVGVAGDTLEMRLGVLYRNGLAQPERYATRSAGESDPPADDQFVWQRDHLVRTAEARVGYHPSRNNWGPLVVPRAHYFVLGDNRDHSLDSRYWGFVPLDHVRAGVARIYLSRDPETGAMRWSRMGRMPGGSTPSMSNTGGPGARE